MDVIFHDKQNCIARLDFAPVIFNQLGRCLDCGNDCGWEFQTCSVFDFAGNGEILR